MRYALGVVIASGFVFASALSTSAVAAQSAAQAYPNKPVRVVIAQGPGSSIDSMARVVFGKMSELIGQQMIMDNRVGAGGTIGGGIVAHAEPDGYTLFAGATASQVIGPQLYKKLTTYDPFKDFQPISQFAITQNVLVVNPQTPFKSVKDLVAHAKANPGKLNWSNAGSGFQSHLAGVLFTHMAGIDVLHVPYKGAGPSLAAAISGESQVTFVPAPSVMGHLQSGRLRALAVGGDKRSAVAPDLPTVIESGVPGFVSSGWAGLMAPRGVPKPITDKLRVMLHRAVNDPATNSAMRKLGAEPVIGTSEEFARLIKADWKNFGDAIRVAGLKAN